MPRIGVFDSGIGGKSVANAIQKAMPDAEVIFVNDTKNVPYGTKTPAVLLELMRPILHDLAQRVDIIVIACNTATTTLIKELRQEIEVPLIGMEPMVKPAAAITRSGVIAVCATPGTLSSKRYAWLKDTYATHTKVLEPDCSDWASMIEANHIDRKVIESRISAVCQEGADVIVLGCTHYHWIEMEIQDIANKYHARVIQPERAIIARLEQVLGQLA